MDVKFNVSTYEFIVAFKAPHDRASLLIDHKKSFFIKYHTHPDKNVYLMDVNLCTLWLTLKECYEQHMEVILLNANHDYP